MATTVLDAYSKAYPSITNRIRASVFSESDPLTIVASIIDSTAGHPTRIWHFPGLPRDNYGFSLDEINGSGDPVNNLALFDVVPGTMEGLLTRADEQIQVGTTTGFDAGDNSFTFDGTAGRPDYVGWDIVPSELTGRGILVEGLDYSWVPATGVFTLLQGGDIFASGQYYNIHFNPAQGLAGQSVPTITDFSQRVITASETLVIEDFGNEIIVEPASPYIELTLPVLNTVARGRVLRISTVQAIGTGMSCVKFIPNGSDTINFMNGSLFMMSNESIELYRLRRADLSNEWRVVPKSGNFYDIGQSTSEDATAPLVYSKHLMNGGVESTLQYARIFNQYVLNLPATQLVDFDAWATGNNKYFYSKANSANPANANKFHFPDRRDLFERNNNAGKSGDFKADQVKISDMYVELPVANAFTGSAGGDWVPPTAGHGHDGPVSVTNQPVKFTVPPGAPPTETNPKQYLINKFVKV